VRGLLDALVRVIDEGWVHTEIFEEEAFGPLVIILTFKTDAEAVALANGTAYGLTSSIYSKNIARASNIGAQIDTGLVHINGSTIHDAQVSNIERDKD